MSERILVLGATGMVGGLVVEGLRRRGASLRLASRHPQEKQSDDWIAFDFERPDTFARAVNGVARAFLIARPGDPEPQIAAGPLISEMQRAGVRHVVHLSAMGVETREDIGLRKVELLLEASGMAFTHLRPNFFMQVFTVDPLRELLRTRGLIRVPADQARISYIDARDVAAVAVEALTKSEHENRAYTLTGGASLDHYDIAAAIAEGTSKSVRYEPISEDLAREAISSAGYPADRVERLIGFYRLVRAGFCAPVTPDTEQILGRPAVRFSQFACDYAGAWSS